MGLFSSLFGGGNKITTTTQKVSGSNATVQTPFAVSKTTKKGSNSYYKDGSAFDTIDKFVNSNIGNILNDYLHPSLESDTNKTLLNNYIKNLGNTAQASFENNVINPLSARNMIRSSQATNMYKNFSNKLSDNVSSYINQLLSESQQNSANMLTNLLNAYTQGVNALNANQVQSLNTSLGNATTKTKGAANNSASSNQSYVNTLSTLLPLLLGV